MRVLRDGQGPLRTIAGALARHIKSRDFRQPRSGALDATNTNGTLPILKFLFLKEHVAHMLAWWNMERERQNPLGAVLTDERKRGFFDTELRSQFPACHDRSSRIDELLLQLQRSELDQHPEPGASVLLAGS